MKLRTIAPAGRGPEAEKEQALRAGPHVFYRLIDPRDKARVLSAVRECAAGVASAAQHRTLLAERARLIPDFSAFRSLVLEDLREAYEEDRLQKTRAAKNRRRVWLNLFKPFARLRQIKEALVIRALDRSGNYECALVEREAPDRWGKFTELGARFGISEADLIALYERARERAKKRA